MNSYQIVEAALEGNNQFLVLIVPGKHNFQGKRIRIGGKTIQGMANGDNGMGGIIGLPPVPGWYPVLNQIYVIAGGQLFTAVGINYPGSAPSNGQYNLGDMSTNVSGFFRNRRMDAVEIYKPLWGASKSSSNYRISQVTVQNAMANRSQG